MKIRKRWTLMVVAFALVACGEKNETYDNTKTTGAEGSARYNLIVMDDDLQKLKDDFNANVGRVRLLFLSGPTCGICLRGMADLNDAFIAASQGDDRLVTFVVHVPTMGAKEHHASDSMPLLDGPRVHHYWEVSGIIGQHYTDVLDVEMYVCDFWAIYGPDAVWEGTLPPVPDYYEHQLGVTGGGREDSQGSWCWMPNDSRPRQPSFWSLLMRSDSPMTPVTNCRQKIVWRTAP